MKIYNVHERALSASSAEVGELLDSLSTADDRLWPSWRWPALKLDGPLAEGAVGGHGPVRYRVSDYRPGRMVAFQFLSTHGIVGGHRFEIDCSGSRPILRHVIEARGGLLDGLRWALIIRPLHDALLEDLLYRAESRFSAAAAAPRLGWRVLILRYVLGRLLLFRFF